MFEADWQRGLNLRSGQDYYDYYDYYNYLQSMAASSPIQTGGTISRKRNFPSQSNDHILASASS